MPRPGPVPKSLLKRRILAGPFDDHLDHAAVQNIFRPYGNVEGGGWYHRLSHVHRTYGFVDFETEAEANHVIQCLTQGSFRSHGKDLRMVNVVASGKLPMGLDEWIDELSFGWRDETTSADADDKDRSNAAGSPNHIEDDDSKDVDKGDESRAAVSSSHVNKDDSSAVDAGDNGNAATPPSGTKIQVVIPAPLSAAHHHNSKYFDVFDKS